MHNPLHHNHNTRDHIPKKKFHESYGTFEHILHKVPSVVLHRYHKFCSNILLVIPSIDRLSTQNYNELVAYSPTEVVNESRPVVCLVSGLTRSRQLGDP